jgi:hypothetical protein
MTKSLLNTNSRSPNIFSHIEKTLADHGVTEFAYQLGVGDFAGKRMGMTFSMRIRGQTVKFRMPVRVSETQRAMYNKARTNTQRNYITWARAYQTAWATVRDLIDLQMAMVDLGLAIDTAEAFAAYMLDEQSGMTLYEIITQRQYQLPEPEIEYKVGEVVT